MAIKENKFICGLSYKYYSRKIQKQNNLNTAHVASAVRPKHQMAQKILSMRTQHIWDAKQKTGDNTTGQLICSC